MDGKVTSSSSTKNNPDADFMNQLKQFENNEDISEQNIKEKDFYYNEMMKSQGIYPDCPCSLYDITSLMKWYQLVAKSL